MLQDSLRKLGGGEVGCCSSGLAWLPAGASQAIAFMRRVQRGELNNGSAQVESGAATGTHTFKAGPGRSSIQVNASSWCG